MSRSIEWRCAPDGAYALVAVEDAGTVVQAWPAEPELVADFLNDMTAVRDGNGSGVTVADPDPDGWGELVIARSADGDVLFIDPELYWNGIADLFRSRGDDPHPWRGRP